MPKTLDRSLNIARLGCDLSIKLLRLDVKHTMAFSVNLFSRKPNGFFKSIMHLFISSKIFEMLDFKEIYQ